MSKINKWIIDNLENASDGDKELFWATVQHDITKIVNNLRPEDKAWLIFYIHYSLSSERELEAFKFAVKEFLKLDADELERVANNWRLG